MYALPACRVRVCSCVYPLPTLKGHSLYPFPRDVSASDLTSGSFGVVQCLIIEVLPGFGGGADRGRSQTGGSQ